MSADPATRSKTDIMKVLEADLDEHGGYPVNSLGQTYGSGSAAGAIGYSPDLLAVMATNGEFGYAKKDEFYFAGEHSQKDPASSAIPVYNLSGKVIGEFKFELGVV